MKIAGGILLILALTLSALLYASRPQLDGPVALSGLSDSVSVRRDTLGNATIEARSRTDLARATGFVHAQERFLSMDMRRRFAAGKMAALLGPASLEFDRHNRKHRFEKQARRMLTELSPDERELLEAYTEGVNQGLAALPVWPFPYFLLMEKPRPWAAEDSLLVLFSMHLVLQGTRWEYDATVTALAETFGRSVADFLAPTDTHHAAALDDSSIPWLVSDIPQAYEIDLRNTPLDPDALNEVRAHWERSGSSAMAVNGAITEHGSAILANDMHLVLMVPNIWYRVHWKWQSKEQAHMASGLSLPGMPWLVAGSNGHIAWGFTNSNIDSQDLIILSDSDPIEHIRTPHEVAFVPDPEATSTGYSRWGPIVLGDEPEMDWESPRVALRWASHWLQGAHINFSRIEKARDVAGAMQLFQQSAIPAQNVLIADRHGAAGWTIAGPIFRRLHHNGRTAISGDKLQSPRPQWLSPEGYPRILRPRLWSANQRHIGGESFRLLGDGRYTAAMRGRQIRERMLARQHFTEADLLAIQLDARADYLAEWETRLERILEHPEVRETVETHQVRRILDSWDGQAHPDSIGYRLLQTFRKRTHELFLRTLLSRMQEHPYFRPQTLRWQLDGPLTRLIDANAQHFLPQGYTNWEDLMGRALSISLDEMTADGPLDEATWGELNQTDIRHPLSHVLPPLGLWLDPPSHRQAGDLNLPRVARPGFGASHRTVVTPGREEYGILHMPGGQSGHPLSPFFHAGHEDWMKGLPSPFLPGPDYAVMQLAPAP